MGKHHDGPRYTPGPWRFEMYDDGDSTVGVPSSNHCVLAITNEGENIPICEVFWPDDYSGRLVGLQGSNARLIAAAPELLESLKEVVAISDRKHDAWIKAHAVIARAEGTTPP